MKKQIILILFLQLILYQFLLAQVSFLPCTNCQNAPNNDSTITYTFGSTMVLETEDITSDFGARRLSESCSPIGFNYDWHGGVDYRDLTSTNHGMGDAFLALDGGDVNRICGDPGIKYIVIEGINFDYAFLHIFHDSNGQIGPNGERKMGRFVMVPFNYNNSTTDTICRFAMVDLQTSTAIAAIPDNCPSCTFTYNNVVYSQVNNNLFNTVNTGDPIAPMGNSGGYLPHLHISQIIDVTEQGSSVYNDDNTTDIWETVQPVPNYDSNPTNFDLEFRQMNGQPGFEIVYPGSNPTRFRLRATMSGFQQPGVISRYSNTLMAVEKVELLLRKSFEPNSSFEHIVGATHKSYIEEGGIPATSPTVSTPYPPHIHLQLGNWFLQGIRPFAYSECEGHQGRDDYFFTDFVTRIHKNSPTTGNPWIADCPQDARYNDGSYRLEAVIEDVRGHQETRTDDFNLDNFQPFIQEVKILANNNPNSVIYYENWICNNGCIEFSNNNIQPQYEYFELNNNLYVHVQSSEPLEELSMDIYRMPFPPAIPMWKPVLENVVATSVDNSKQNWVFEFPTSPPSPLMEHFFQFRFSGHDTNQNALLHFSQEHMNGCYTLPTRLSPLVWDNPDNLLSGIDDIHQFTLNCLIGNRGQDYCFGGVGSLITPSSGPQTQDGAISLTLLDPNMAVGDVSYQWDNGQTTSELINLDPGTYCVTLKDELCCQETQCFIVPDCSEYSAEDFLDSILFSYGGPCNGAISFFFDTLSGPFNLIIQEDGTFVHKSYNLSGTFQVENLCSGLYDISIENQATNCSYSLSDIEILDCGDITMEGLDQALIPPTTCGGNDGLIIFNTGGGPTGGISPYTVELFDDQGNLIPKAQNLLAWENLESGNYLFVVKDAIGCVGAIPFSLADAFAPIILSNTYPSCPNQSTGIIEVLAYVPDESNEYQYSWSTGEVIITDEVVEMEELGAGFYEVSISLPGEDCEIIESFEVTEYDVDPIIVNGEIYCSGFNALDIDLNIEGGVGPFSYDWDSPLANGANPSELPPGTYCVTVTDDCENQASNCFGYTPIGSYVSTDPGCVGGGTATVVSVSGGHPPYTYHWSSGQTTPTASGLYSGLQCVTITDAVGCTHTNCVELKNKYYSFSVEDPCEGFNDGIAYLGIQNPEHDSIHITLNGFEFYNDPAPGGLVFIDVENLSPSSDYFMQITIGECVYHELFHVGAIPITEVFNHYEDETCYYDEYCQGELLMENAVERDLFYDYANASGGWFLKKCTVDAFCDDHFIFEKKYNNVQVKAFEYQQILLAAFNNSPFDHFILQSLYNTFLSLNLSPCATLKYCPTTLEITSKFSIFTGFDSATEVSPGCFHLECIWPSQDADFCVEDIVPDYFGTINGGETAGCDPRQFRVYQLILWFNDLLDTYPNFEDPNNPTSLYSFLLNVQNDLDLLEKSKCATVTFCLSDFTVLGTDVYTVDCEGNGIPDPQPCECGNVEDSDLIICWCKQQGCPEGCIALAPVFFNPQFPGDLNLTPGEDPDVASRYYPQDGTPTEFRNFAFTTYEGRKVPKGLIATSEGFLFEEFSHHSNLIERTGMHDIRFLEDNWDNGQLAYLAKSNEHQYAIYFEDTTSIWIKPLHTNDQLTVEDFYQTAEGLLIFGSFSGELALDSIPLQTSNEEVFFTLGLSTSGEVKDLHIIENITGENVTFIQPVGNELYITASADDPSIVIDGMVESLPGAGSVFTIRLDTSANTYQINTNLSLSGGLTHKQVALSGDGDRQAHLISGSGTIKINDQVTTTIDTDQLSLVVIDEEGSLQFIDTFNSTTFEKAVLDFQPNNNLILSLTFSGTIFLQNDTIESAGGQDILLIKYDQNGNQAGVLHYGSPDHEDISELYVESALIYFGGNFYGNTSERKIGYYNFVNHSVSTENAYLSFVTDYDFSPAASAQSMIEEPIEFNHSVATSFFDLEVFPNPTKGKFNIKLTNTSAQTYRIELYNALGKLVSNRSIQGGQNGKNQLDEPLILQKKGVYFLVVTDESGHRISQKIIKN